MNVTNAAMNTHSIAAILPHNTSKHIGITVFCLLVGVIWSFVPHPIVVIALGLAPLGALFVMRYTFFLVLMFIIFSFFRIHEVFPALYNLKIPLMLSMSSLMSLMWNIFITQKIRVYWRSELTIASVFFALVFIGVFTASNRPIAIEYFKGIYWKIIIMMFAIAWITRGEREFTIAQRLIVLSGSLVGVVAIMNKMNGIGLVEGTRVTIGRDLGSLLGDPNDLALVLMFPSAFAISLLLTPGLRKLDRMLGLVSVPLLFFALMATQSRGGLLGVLAVFAVYGYQRIKSKVLLATIGTVLACGLFLFAGISDRSSGGAAEEGIDESAQGRLYAWEAAIRMSFDNPLTGVGIDNFYSNYFFYSPHWDGLNHAVHSTWFGVLAETGILGFGVFIYLIVRLIKASSQSIKSIDAYYQGQSESVGAGMKSCSQAVFASLIGTIVSGTFLTHGFTWPIYILAGLVVALSHWAESHTAKDLTAN